MKRFLTMWMICCLLLCTWCLCAPEGTPATVAAAEAEAAVVAPKKVVIDQKSTVTVYIDSPVQLTTHFEPAEASSALTWSSSSKKRATVDAGGVVTGVSEGTAKITVKTANGKKATVKVKVVDPYKPTGVSLLQKGTVTVNCGETLQLNAELSPSTARSSLTWSSSSKKRATVNGDGVVTGVSEGTAKITVKTANGKKATVKVKVVDPYKPTGVSLSESGTLTMNRGDKLSLTATLSPSTARSSLTWSSSSKKYVTVNGSGVVTAVSEGSSTITVKTANGKKATLKIKVVDPYKPTGISLAQKGTVQVRKGETVQLDAALSPATAQSNLSWTSSNKKRATVSAGGVVTGVSEGTATITVSTFNGKKATVKVQVIAAATQPPEVSNGNAKPEETAQPAPAPTAQPATPGTSTDASQADAVFQRVNAFRAQNGAKPLKRNAELDRAAAVRAQEIATCFSHTRPDGSVWYSVSDLAYGENIARGYKTAETVMNGWIASAGHRANMLDDYATIGIAVKNVNGVMCWVQLFGY